jgi:hypothetical protein
MDVAACNCSDNGYLQISLATAWEGGLMALIEE